jgi:hypothetical protein
MGWALAFFNEFAMHYSLKKGSIKGSINTGQNAGLSYRETFPKPPKIPEFIPAFRSDRA